MRKLFDRLQVWLYLAGFERLARVTGRLGSRPAATTASKSKHELPYDGFHDRDTLPDGVPAGRENMEGPGWRLDEFPPEVLRIKTFDRTFNDNRGIDMRDVAIPRSKLDVS